MTSTYHLNGFNRLNSDNVLLMVILTVVGGLINAVHTSLCVAAIGLAGGLTTGLAVAKEPSTHCVAHCCCISSREDLAAAHRVSLELDHGSADSRLSELEALLEAPNEGTACKMWKLLKGYPRGMLSQVIDMIRQLPFES